MRRFPRAAGHVEALHVEALEPRQLQSATPAPGDGNDYVMLAPDAGRPVVHATPEQVRRTPLPGGFKWFDASPAQGLARLVPGVVSVACDDRGMFPTGADGLPIYGERIDQANTRALARRAAASGGVLVLDIENWAMNVTSVEQATANRSAERFAQVIDWCRDEAPALKIGIYGELPSSEVWASQQMSAMEDAYATTGSGWHMFMVSSTANMHARWQAANDFMRPLAAKVDYLFPSLYTFYSGREGWAGYAKSVIDEARTFGKPVIPFVWPGYHNAGDFPGRMLEDDFWALELDTLRAYADGGVIWHDRPYDGAESWVGALDDRRTDAASATRRPAARDATGPFGATRITRDDDDDETPSPAAALLAA